MRQGTARVTLAPMKLLIYLVLAAAAFFAFRWFQGRNSGEAHELVAKGALLLDVRTPGEFQERHLEGAVNIPVQELDRRLAEVGAKDRPVVVYCRSGARSGRAKGMLEAAGFRKVVNLGPMSAW
jgi:phage shock protein E